MNDNRTQVQDIMSTPLRMISRRATVADAAKTMREADISALVTTGTPSIITSTDVLDVVASDRDPSEVPVADVMTESVETIPPDLLLEEAAAMMTNFGIKHLPVVEGDDYVGMISSTDITAYLA